MFYAVYLRISFKLCNLVIKYVLKEKKKRIKQIDKHSSGSFTAELNKPRLPLVSTAMPDPIYVICVYRVSTGDWIYAFWQL